MHKHIPRHVPFWKFLIRTVFKTPLLFMVLMIAGLGSWQTHGREGAIAIVGLYLVIVVMVYMMYVTQRKHDRLPPN